MEHITDNDFPQALPPHLQAQVEAVSEMLADTTDDTDAQSHVDILTAELAAEQLIGKNTRLQSPVLAWSSYVMRDGQWSFQLITDRKILKRSKAEGIFAGFSYYVDENNQKILTYEVKMGFDPETDAYISASAPIEQSKLSFNELALNATNAEHDIARHVQVLAEITEPAFVEELECLINLIDDFHIDGPLALQELGRVGSWLLGHDQIKNDSRMVRALLGVAGELTDRDGVFMVEGYEVIITGSGSQRSILRRKVLCEGTIQAMAAVEDFEMDAQGGSPFEDTLQPTLIMWDSTHNIERYIPLKHISRFVDTTSVQPVHSSKGYCSNSIDRYRDTYFGTGAV